MAYLAASPQVVAATIIAALGRRRKRGGFKKERATERRDAIGASRQQILQGGDLLLRKFAVAMGVFALPSVQLLPFQQANHLYILFANPVGARGQGLGKRQSENPHRAVNSVLFSFIHSKGKSKKTAIKAGTSL